VSDGDVEGRVERILVSALTCFTRYGYRRTSMETIAQAAGMSRPALYQHFSGKEDVFRAGVAYLLDGAATRAEESARSAESVEDRVFGVLATKIDLVIGQLDAEFRGELLLEAAAIAKDLLDAHRERLVQVIAALLESAAAQLPHLGADLPAREAAELLLYAATGIEYEHTTADAAHATLRRAVDLMIRGLRAP
jgi:TetR/AcrR family transcriptional regulator